MEDYEQAIEAANELATNHVIQFCEMRNVYISVGVSGLFHQFEKHLYRFIARELRGFVLPGSGSVNQWRDADRIIRALRYRVEAGAAIVECDDLFEAFTHPDLIELQFVANAVKHGEGRAYRNLLEIGARVVRNAEPNLSFDPSYVEVQVEDVVRYRDAVLRFWRTSGPFWATPADLMR